DRWLISAVTTAAAPAWRDAGADREPCADDRSSTTAGRDLALQCSRCGIVSENPPLPCTCRGDGGLASLPARAAGAVPVTGRLGAGGMGVVYPARDERLARDVALKTLPVVDAMAIGRLRAEARAMAALSHESLATIYGLELWRRTPILIVEYLAGG